MRLAFVMRACELCRLPMVEVPGLGPDPVVNYLALVMFLASRPYSFPMRARPVKSSFSVNSSFDYNK